MSIEPIDLLRCARGLLSTSSPEADLRAGISRAYYASYHAANQFHESLAISGQAVAPRVGSHSALIAKLKNPGVPAGDLQHQRSKKIGLHLEALKLWRVRADYDLTLNVTANDANQQLQNAERLARYIEGPSI